MIHLKQFLKRRKYMFLKARIVARGLKALPPISIPSPLPQPSTAQYAIQTLNNFTNAGCRAMNQNGAISRQSYIDAYGIAAPAYDDSRPVQTWFDSTADENRAYRYNVQGADSAGNPILVVKTMPGAHARTPNLPGSEEYPPYVIEDTDAYQATPDGNLPINARYLCMEDDAKKIMETFGGHDLLEYTPPSPFEITYPDNEPRRWWWFTLDGVDPPVCYPALNIAEMYEFGVGAPGYWDLEPIKSGMEPVWISTYEPNDDPAPNAPVIAMPYRDLDRNEKLVYVSAGTAIMVERTDL
jgi:hypothetical protein